MSGGADHASREFGERTLDRRTVLLAARNRAAPDRARLPGRLVCRTGDRLFALEPSGVATVRPARAHPLALVAPGAAGIMLGVLDQLGRMHSLLDLAALLGEADPLPAGPVAGTMLLLHGPDPGVALRVDRVCGLLDLIPAGPDHALDPDGAPVRLVDPVVIGRAIAALDALAASPDLIGA